MTVAGFSILWCITAATTFAHVRSLAGSEYRTSSSGDTYARFAPHRAGNHVLSVAMTEQGYRVQDENGRFYPTSGNGSGEEQLAIAASPLIGRVWIEAENGGSSRLVELPIAPKTAYAAPIATIPDAESPSLSPDGRHLIFIRENRGTGQAWIADLDEEGKILDAPRPVSSKGLNVWSASLGPPDQITLSAAEHGVPHLFVSAQPGKPLRRIDVRGDAMDAASVNPMNGILVYQLRDGSYWHLFAASLAQGKISQLTFGDCNAYDPAWSDAATLLYVSDCGRGMELGEIAISRMNPAFGEPGNSVSFDLPAKVPQGGTIR